MKIDLVKERETFYFRIFILITLILSFLLWLGENKMLFIIIPLIQFIPLLISPNFLYKKIGTVEFNENEIIILPNNSEMLKIKIDQKIRIRLFLYEASTQVYKKVFSKGFLIRIQIETEDNFFGEYKIVIKKKQIEEFKNLLKGFYEKGINIKERDSLGAKYFLLEGNLSYSKIQEIKSRYNIAW